MEVWTAGTIEVDRAGRLMELLTALAGYRPRRIDVYEITLREEAPGSRQELQLVQYSVPSNSSKAFDRGGAWYACSFGRPPWGEIPLSKLEATVRTVQRSRCDGPDVPGFWTSLGYVPEYRCWKEGRTCDIESGPWIVHILLSKLCKAVEQSPRASMTHRNAVERESGHVSTAIMSLDLHTASADTTSHDFTIPGMNGNKESNGMPVGPGEEVVPGLLLVEAWTEVGSGRHTDAISALTEVGRLLEREGVALRPLLQKPPGYTRRS